MSATQKSLLGLLHPGVCLELPLDAGAEGDEALHLRCPIVGAQVQVGGCLRHRWRVGRLKADLDVRTVEDHGRVAVGREATCGQSLDLGVVVGTNLEALECSPRLAR
jgi:hypothetical protein